LNLIAFRLIRNDEGVFLRHKWYCYPYFRLHEVCNMSIRLHCTHSNTLLVSPECQIYTLVRIIRPRLRMKALRRPLSTQGYRLGDDKVLQMKCSKVCTWSASLFLNYDTIYYTAQCLRT
jgi:hypothetical protein